MLFPTGLFKVSHLIWGNGSGGSEMLLPIEYQRLDEENCLFVDVRSPAEYAEATINGAVNLALFTNEERKIIGTMYKHDSPAEAKQLGVELVSQKLPILFKEITRLRAETGKKMVLFCARGGMRSTSLALLLNGLGEKVYYLKDGYKGYRKVVMQGIEDLNKEVNYIVLHGRTGVGKTKILDELTALGMDVLDLEGGANHRGSLLGGVGLGEQPSTKTFESFIYHTLKNRKTDYIFVESESRRIGKLFVPKSVKSRMIEGQQILVNADLEFRAKHLISEYTDLEPGNVELLEAIDKIRRYMGHEPVEVLQDLVREGDFQKVAEELMVKYYDPMYDHSIEKYKFDDTIQVNDFEQVAQDLKIWLNDHISALEQNALDETLDVNSNESIKRPSED